jgi:hypothetical protein
MDADRDALISFVADSILALYTVLAPAASSGRPFHGKNSRLAA